MIEVFVLRPVVGIISNHYLLNEQYPVHASGTMNGDAVAHVSDCIPLIIPTDPAQVTIEELMATCDGFVFTGAGPMSIPKNMAKRQPKRMANLIATAMRWPWV